MSCRRVPLERQLDGSANQAYDCARATASMLVRHGSHGLIRPSTEEIGRRMNNPTGVSNVADVERAVESYDAEMKRKGYEPLKYMRAGRWAAGLALSGGSTDNLRALVQQDDKLIHVVVDYSRVPDRYRASSFQGLHAIAVGGKAGSRVSMGHLEVRVLDPLADGRSPGTPNGPQWWSFGTLWKVIDGAWSSRGSSGWQGGWVHCAKALASPDPDPVPEPDPCAERIEELEDLLADVVDWADGDAVERIRKALRPNVAREGVAGVAGVITEDQ